MGTKRGKMGRMVVILDYKIDIDLSSQQVHYFYLSTPKLWVPFSGLYWNNCSVSEYVPAFGKRWSERHAAFHTFQITCNASMSGLFLETELSSCTFP